MTVRPAITGSRLAEGATCPGGQPIAQEDLGSFGSPPLNRFDRRRSMFGEMFESQLLAALSVGAEIMLLRRAARMFDPPTQLDAALDTIARGNSAVAVARLASVDRDLAALSGTRPGPRIRLRVRDSLLALSEALTRHAAWFDARAPE
jgi:hypothetical protein